MDEFKSLWSQQSAPEKPDPDLLIQKAVRLKNKTRNKLLMANITCILTGVFIVYIWMNIHPELLSTKAGIILILSGILVFVITSGKIIQPLFKSNEQSSNNEFLGQMLRLRRNQDFMHKILMHLYFFLISSGVFLYMYEFVIRMSLFWGVFTYGITIAWMAFNWLYTMPRTVKKQTEQLNEVISRLQSLEGQWESLKNE